MYQTKLESTEEFRPNKMLKFSDFLVKNFNCGKQSQASEVFFYTFDNWGKIELLFGVKAKRCRT